jgi:cell division protein FtsQ
MLRRGWFYGSRGALAAALLLVVAGGPLWLLRSGILATAERSAAETYQSLRRGAEADFAIQLDGFTVHGRNRTSREAVRGALQIRRGDSLLAMDPWVIKRRLETLPWVRTATVTRRFPNTVVIELVERTPVARYRDRSGTVLVDNAGAIIPVAAEREHENLVLLAGEGAPAAANSLLKLLEQEPALARRVVTATRYGNRRWDLLFDGGTVLRLPDGYEKAAITKFGEFERAHNLLSRGAVTYDMRLPDRLVVRSQREPAPAAPPSEKTPPAKKARKTG